MTTLEEISTDRKVNWGYWTQCARFSLVCYRHSKCSLEKSGFRSNMRNRRNRTYLNADLLTSNQTDKAG
jgi:hypothetical protein